MNLCYLGKCSPYVLPRTLVSMAYAFHFKPKSADSSIGTSMYGHRCRHFPPKDTSTKLGSGSSSESDYSLTPMTDRSTPWSARPRLRRHHEGLRTISIFCQNDFHDTIVALRMFPDALHLEPDRSKQISELSLRTFSTC